MTSGIVVHHQDQLTSVRREIRSGITESHKGHVAAAAKLFKLESKVTVLVGNHKHLFASCSVPMLALLTWPAKWLVIACRCGLLWVDGHWKAPTMPRSMVLCFSLTICCGRAVSSFSNAIGLFLEFGRVEQGMVVFMFLSIFTLRSALFRVTVFLPSPEVGSLLQVFDKLLKGGTDHVACTEDVVDMDAEKACQGRCFTVFSLSFF